MPDGSDDVGRQPGEDRHPGMQALGEVELAAHGGFGHGSHLLPLARVRGQEFDDFLLDQGGVNVHDQQLPAGRPQAGRHQCGVDAGDGASATARRRPASPAAVASGSGSSAMWTW